MAVIAYVVLPGVTKERHDQIRAEVRWLEEPPAGGISHVTWWEGGARPAGGEDHHASAGSSNRHR
ncbi:MAG TPA: hypothetical protein VF060_33415 [Trebonia sp.]